MSEHGKDHPDEFMSDGHDCLFVGESFLAFLEVVFPEHLIVPCHLHGHKPGTFDYNKFYVHSSLGYLSPEGFERSFENTTAKVVA